MWVLKCANTHYYVVNMGWLLDGRAALSLRLTEIVSVSLLADLSSPGSREMHTSLKSSPTLMFSHLMTEASTTFPLKPAQRLEWVDLCKNWLWETDKRGLQYKSIATCGRTVSVFLDVPWYADTAGLWCWSSDNEGNYRIFGSLKLQLHRQTNMFVRVTVVSASSL